jgi:transposase-like protein
MLGIGPPANRRARHEWWRRQIQRQQDGSLSIAEFCRRLGVSTVTFYAWRRRFREAPPASPLISESPAAKSSTANGAVAPAFLPVSMLAAGPDGQLEIALANACVVRLKGSVDPGLLRVAIRAAGRLGDRGRGAN